MSANGPASSSVKPPVHANPISWLILGGVLLIAAITIGTTFMAGNFRERTLNSSKRELENTVLLLARHFEQQFEYFGAIQEDIAKYIQSAGVDTGDYRRRMSNPDIHEMLKAKIGALSYVGGINLFDSDGALVNSSMIWPVPAINVADRAYFKSFKSGARSPSFLVEPVYSRLTGAWTVVLARKLTGRNGEFLGVIGRGIEPAHFEKFFASVALGNDASISMVHRDGTLLARYPHNESMIGHKSGAMFQRVLSQGGTATGVFNSPLDGQDRLGAAYTLSGFPILVVATTTVSAALADWRAQSKFLIGVGGLSVLVITAMLFLVVRKLSHQHRLSQQRLWREKRRLDTAVNNMTQGLLLFDSSERLIVCNQRYLDMYGLSTEVVKQGCSFREVIAHRKATGSFMDDVDEYCERVRHEIGLRKSMIIETPDGRAIQMVNEPLADGGWVATLEDITERRHAEARITHLAHYDALTDLPNRALFHEQLKRELARIAPGEQLAVMYIGIDEFKSVNDTLGHLIGDELLKSVAVSLSRCVRDTDFVARLGGDEFAIVQTGIRTADEVTGLV